MALQQLLTSVYGESGETMKTLLLILLLFAAPVTAQDAVPIGQARLTGGANVSAWPATTTITSLSTGALGLEAQFSKRQGADWPDIIPAGWSGPVYYTVWLGTRLADGVHLAAALNVYRGQVGSGAGDVTNIGQYSQNLWYLDGELKRHVTQEGETLYLMLTAGGLRGVSAVTVQERSNIVAFTASGTPRTFTYTAEPPPVVTPPPVIPPDPVPDLTDRVEHLEELLAHFQQSVIAIEGRVTALEARPIYTQCQASVFRIAVSCTLK